MAVSPAAGSAVPRRLWLLILAALICLSAPGAAHASTGWSAPTDINTNNGLTSVSCPTSSFCAAVDDNGDALIYTDGSWGAPSSIDSNGSLSSVSCSSASYCVAVDPGGNAVVYTDGSWGTPTPVDSGGQSTVAVSCAPSPTVPAPFCVAVDVSGRAVIDQNGTWGSPDPIDSEGPLISVSCPTASFCMAVDFGGNAVTYDGMSWADPAPIATGTYMSSVSCSSSSFCAAVGVIIGGGSINAYGYTWDGGDWSSGQLLSAAVGSLEQSSVSCTSDSFCQAVYASPDAAVFDGTSWAVQSGVDSEGDLSSLSCPTQEFCEAVDSSGDALTFTQAAPLPVSTSPPTLSDDNAVVGQTLTEVNGGWSNPPITSYSYEWEDCDLSGASCVPIAGATGQTYKVQTSDVGHTIEVAERASNAGGPALKAADSAPTEPVVPPAPVSTSPPTVSGNAVVGQRLTEVNGAWSNPPITSYSYEWEDCDLSGASCVPIAGATGQTYKVQTSDVGHTIEVAERASNAGGTGVAMSSAPTSVIPAPAGPPSPPPAPELAPVQPAVGVAPGVRGRAVAGTVLSAGTGTWSGTAPLAYSYQWERCRRSCAGVSGATGSAYKLRAADLGARIRVLVTASNAAGATQAVSGELGPVLPSDATIRASLTRQIKPRGARAKIGVLLIRKGYPLLFRAPSAGVIKVTWYYAPEGHMVRFGSGRASLSGVRPVKVQIRLTRRGKGPSARLRRLRVRAQATFTPAGGRPVRVTKTFTLIG